MKIYIMKNIHNEKNEIYIMKNIHNEYIHNEKQIYIMKKIKILFANNNIISS